MALNFKVSFSSFIYLYFTILWEFNLSVLLIIYESAETNNCPPVWVSETLNCLTVFYWRQKVNNSVMISIGFTKFIRLILIFKTWLQMASWPAARLFHSVTERKHLTVLSAELTISVVTIINLSHYKFGFHLTSVDNILSPKYISI